MVCSKKKNTNTRAAFTFKSENGQNYLYSPAVNKIFLIHPVLNFIWDLQKKDFEINKWINSVKKEGIFIENYGYVNQNQLKYYFQKYLFFKKNNLFKKYKIEEKFNKKVTENDIKTAFVNVNRISFEVTEQCNLSCKYCTYSELYTHHEKKKGESCDIDLAKKVLQYFNKLRFSDSSFSKHKNFSLGFYGGEPFLYMKFIKEIVRFAESIKKKNQEIVYHATTNGTLIDKYLDFLVKHNFGLLISIDGDEKNNAFRTFHNGKPSYKKVKQNIDLIQKKYPDYFKNNVFFNTVIHKKNSIKEIYTFFKKEGWQFPSLSEVSLFWVNKNKKDRIKTIYNSMYEEIINKDFDPQIEKDMGSLLPDIMYTNTLSKMLGGYIYNLYSDFFEKKYDGPLTPTSTCLPFSFKVFVSVQGDLMACENTGSRNAFDVLDKKNVVPDFEKIARRYSDLLDKAILTQCNSCYRIDTCPECIHMFLNEDTVNKCKSFSNKEQFQKVLSHFLSKLERKPGQYCRVQK